MKPGLRYLTQCQDIRRHLKLSSMQLLFQYFTKFRHLFFFFTLSYDSLFFQERVIENLREQKEREDRTRLEELEQMRKENQELKNKLSALQPPNTFQNQATNPSVTQNQRPDREVGTHESVSQIECCVDDKDISILGTSNTEYKSRQRKERHAL